MWVSLFSQKVTAKVMVFISLVENINEIWRANNVDFVKKLNIFFSSLLLSDFCLYFYECHWDTDIRIVFVDTTENSDDISNCKMLNNHDISRIENYNLRAASIKYLKNRHVNDKNIRYVVIIDDNHINKKKIDDEDDHQNIDQFDRN